MQIDLYQSGDDPKPNNKKKLQRNDEAEMSESSPWIVTQMFVRADDLEVCSTKPVSLMTMVERDSNKLHFGASRRFRATH